MAADVRSPGALSLASGSPDAFQPVIAEESSSLQRMFNARSVAVVGASSDPTKLGHVTLASILAGGFTGHVYPVNPKGGTLFGLPVYPSLRSVPDPVDLVVSVVPARHTHEVLMQAADVSAGSLMVMSAGFGESGNDGLERELVSTAKGLGIRLLGPNIQGMTYLPNRLCAMFWPVLKTRGPLAVVGQSGTVTAALGEWASREGLGVSAIVNLGNQADICEAEVLSFLADDGSTRAVALYVEAVSDGKRYLSALDTVRKRGLAVAVLKGGRTRSGQLSAASHTAALGGSGAVFEAACRQHGAVVASSLDALYDVSKALALLGPIRRSRVLALSSSGGAATLLADAAEQAGVPMAPLPHSFVDALKALGLPPSASFRNPLDLASLDLGDFRRVIELAAEFDVADVLVLLFGDPIEGADRLVAELRRQQSLPLVAVFLGGGDTEGRARWNMHRGGTCVFPGPERAMSALAAALRWSGESD
jgi:acyl-CoA synthetase (NDP forming)